MDSDSICDANSSTVFERDRTALVVGSSSFSSESGASSCDVPPSELDGRFLSKSSKAKSSGILSLG